MSGILGKGLSYKEYLYDFDEDGGVKDVNICLSDKNGCAPIPSGAVVVNVIAKVITAVTSDGAATVSWGTESDEDGYSGTTIAKGSLTANSIWSPGVQGSETLLWDDSNDHNINYYVADADGGSFEVLISTANLTAGKIVFGVFYWEPAVDQ